MIPNSIPPTVTQTPHGYTEVVMAVAALLGFDLAPRTKDIKDQTLYKMDRQQVFPNLDPILTGTIKTHLVQQAWDETVRVVASISGPDCVRLAHSAPTGLLRATEQHSSGVGGDRPRAQDDPYSQDIGR